MTRKILSAFLCFCLIVVILPIGMTAQAGSVVETGQCSSNIRWYLYDDGTLRFSGKGSVGSWNCVSHYIEKKVKSVVIEKGITDISEAMFSGCNNLTAITIAGTVEKIGDRAFYDCWLLKSIVIPEGTVSIGEWAFYGCSALESLSLPSTLKLIDEQAFVYMDNRVLSKITVHSKSKYFTVANGVLFSKDMTRLVLFPSARKGNYTVPAGTKKIGEAAFASSNLDSVVLPNGLTEIGKCAFMGCCGLTEITIPGSVKRIGGYAFNGCGSITEAVIEKGVEYIEGYAFCGCVRLENIRIPSTVVEIGLSAFDYCEGAKTITIGDNNPENEAVTVIGEDVFNGCTAAEKVIIGSNVAGIGVGAFRNCSGVKELWIHHNIKSIETAAFDNAFSLKDIYYSGTRSQWDTIEISKYNNTNLKEAVLHCTEPLAAGADDTAGVIVSVSSETVLQTADDTISAANAVSVSTVIQDTGALTEKIGNTPEDFIAYDIDVQTSDGIDVSVSAGELVFDVPMPDGLRPETSQMYEFSAYCFDEQGEYQVIDGTATVDGASFRVPSDGTFLVTWKIKAVNRLYGSSRLETAARISAAGFESAESIVVCNADNYADALAGVPLAYALNAPILLLRSGIADEATMNEIARLAPENVYILGGMSAVDSAFEAIFNSEGYNVIRIAGENRFETAVRIAEKLAEVTGKAPQEVFLAYSHNYPDALAISSAAAINSSPVLYIGGNGELDEATAMYLANGGAQKAVILGGTAVISPAAENNIGILGIADVNRISGDNRYETCIEINKAYCEVLDGDSLCIATGLNYPDALAGGVFAAKNRAPLVLVGDRLTDVLAEYIGRRQTENVYIFGGTGAVSAENEEEIAKLIK